MSPIPGKLVHHIQNGNFIDLSELLSANLEATNVTEEDQLKINGHKLQHVTNIINRKQCFSTYIAVVSCTKPECVVDLVAYLNLIIKSFRTLTGHLLTANSAKGINYLDHTMWHHKRQCGTRHTQC